MTEISEKENDSENRDTYRGHVSTPTQPESKLQRLKRSLSFKSVMRSKSVDNFFQRGNNNNLRLPPVITANPPPPLSSPPPPPFPESPLAYERSPSLSSSASPDPSLSSCSPNTSPSATLAPAPGPAQVLLRPVKTHCFQDHVFRKPTCCERCKQMIQGNSKQGIRCKTCKLGAHLWCSSELSTQPCNGKTGAFKRNFSSPLLTSDALGMVREAPPSQEGCVDPVYEALRYGTSLAQLSRSSFSSTPESPCHECPGLETETIAEEEPIPGTLTPPESEKADSEDQFSMKSTKRVDTPSVHTYVALYKFLPQEKNDLEMQPGDRIHVTDDSNEDWWKGKSRERVGYFPANFVQRVRPGERVWKVTAGFHGNRDKGQMTVKEGQVCVGKTEEADGFLRLSSGKKRGLVPVKNLLDI
ncbi:SH3 and cysteine-rich domain-containing protein 2-like [Gadus chalcogrammus]|uniref:SH3 and cysteine-rich domain-containing protein 2-like n=1 Tax=Gadus chalcogrammus TaxID=1042646 RepID=UPI0024C49F2D|nr:SH3 and cysteine-rich domain-containing protein 2-like [Gadus chalcogrammus]